MCEIKSNEEYKVCRKCNELLPVDSFTKNPKLKSGYNGSCRSCSNRYVKKDKSKVIDGYKTCSKCNELLPVNKFRKNLKIKSGIHSSCRSCDNYIKKLPSSEVMDGHKMCTKCNELLPVDKFRENLKVKSGLHSHCVNCCTPPKKIREPKVVTTKKIREPKVVTTKKIKPPRIVDGKCVCRTCQMTLPIDDFYKYKSGTVKIDCKKCTLERNKESYKRNYKPGRYKEHQKQYRKNKQDERRVIREKEKLIIQQEKERIKREKEELKLKNSISRTCKVCEIEKPVDEMKGFTCKKCCNIQKRERTKKRMKDDDEFRKLKNRRDYERKLRRMEQDEGYKERLSRQRYEREKRKLETDEEYRERQRIYSRDRGKKRFNNDPLFRFKKLMRNNIRNSFNRGGFSKTSQTNKILGADWDVVKKYFENRFKEGMTWDNMGLWHIDHILPLSTATCEEDVVRLNHYTNLQPLWAEDNLNKGNTKTIESFFKEYFPFDEIQIISDSEI